jgi:twitching motility protein PilT
LPDFASGIRAALREDPDVVLVGELRDAETITMAMTAAETGHLVLGTLHTIGAVKTIDRVIDALPSDYREQTKAFMAQSLNAVVTQNLVKTPDGKGRRAVLEIMIKTRAIANLIMTDQVHQIPSELQTGGALGMQGMDQALLDAIQNKLIDSDDAVRFAHDKSKFQRFVTDTTILTKADIAT